MKTIEAIVLAGGLGGRLADLTNDRQKCLLPIDGKPVLGHIMEFLVDAFGSVDLKIAVSYRAEDVKDYVERNRPKMVTVTYVPHELGTEGWGIYKEMREYIHGPFVATPGDIIALSNAYVKVLEMFELNGADAAMTLSPNLDVVDTHGIGMLEGNRVTYLEWPPPRKLDPQYLRDMTIWASDTRMFDMIEQYPSPKKSIGYVFMKAIRDNRPIVGNIYEQHWIHIGYPEDLKKSMLSADLV